GDGVEPLLAPAEELVRIPGEEDARADGEERPGAEPLVEREGVVDAELQQRDAEPGEAHDRDRPRPAVETGDDHREPDERPRRAHGDVAAVEPGLDVAGTELEELEDRERERVHAEDAGRRREHPAHGRLGLAELLERLREEGEETLVRLGLGRWLARE